MSKKRRRSKSMMPALLIGAGVLAYFMFSKKSGSEPQPGTGAGYEPGTGEVVDNGTGTGTQVIQPPPIVAPPALATNLLTAAAINDRSALLRYSTDATFQAAIKKMNDAETITAYNYVFGYVIQGKKLYQYPNASGIFSDGGWDTTLYNQVAALRAKYNVF